MRGAKQGSLSFASSLLSRCCALLCAEDIQTALLSMEGALEIVLRTAGAIYEPTPWSFGEEANDQWATREERSTVSGWAWKVFGDVSALGMCFCSVLSK